MQRVNTDIRIKSVILAVLIFWIISGESFPQVPAYKINGNPVPQISGLFYDNITTNSVRIRWTTDIPAHSGVYWMASDSNEQPILYTDSVKAASLVTNHEIIVTGLKPAIMYRYRIISSATSGTSAASGYFITQSASTGKVTVWFNHTIDTTVSSGKKANGKTDFEKLLRSQIEKASHSIDITLWELNQLDSVATSLIKAKDRGVKIRFVYNHLPDSKQIDTLRAHGIRIVKRNFDNSFSMHNKFLIFDHRYNTNPTNQYLWTGSTNVTHAQFHSDRNNIIIIQDQSLCEVYTREFEEMWGSHTDEPDTARSKFGIEKTDNTAHLVNAGGVAMQVYFAPTDSIADTLVSLFRNYPVKSIYFSMLKFVLPSVENALHDALLKGIRVSGVFDSSCSVQPGAAWPRMKGQNVPGVWQPPADVFIDTIPGLIHHKYSLINADTTAGEKILTTGSFNWETPAQQNNDENMLVIRDPTIVNEYYQEFMARYRESGGNMPGYSWGVPFKTQATANSLQAYPNPFNEKTTLRLFLQVSQHIRLILNDLTGKVDYTVFNGLLPPGTHEIVLEGQNLPGGMFILTSEWANGKTQTKLLHFTSK